MTVTLARWTVNGDHLNERIERLARVGKMPNGSLCRLAFTPEDLQARYLVQQWMVEAGMTVRTDAAGNLIGRYEGEFETAPALATGSHIDTVPSGGRFDGVLGVLAGIEVVETLRRSQRRLRHPIEVIVFSDEENTMIGCQAMAGMVDPTNPRRYHPKVDSSIEDCLDRVGGNWVDIASARRSRADMAAFVELHVEQGAVLEHFHKEIGIVQGVVGIRRQSITIHGEANHAGTTPINLRKDALITAAEITLAVRRIAQSMPSEPVATVGHLEVAPNAVNIVPGWVNLSVDMRDLSKDCLDQMVDQLAHEVQASARAHQTLVETHPLLNVEPSPAALSIQNTIESVCHDLNLSFHYLPSRAGHDALELGRITDMGMIFVPSQCGISHSDAEYTSPQQCTQGADVLLNTLLALDKMYPV